MRNEPIELFNFWTENKKILPFYLLIATILLLSIIGFLLLKGKILIAGAFVGMFLSACIITQPKIVLYQFVFMMFTNYLFLENPVILFIDISALLVMVTALFDLLLKGEYKLSFPKLSFNFITIILVFCIVAFFSYNPTLSLMPILHMVYLFVTFISLYRLASYASLEKLLHLFFFFAVLHAFIALLPYFGASKVERLFGFARSTLDDIMMIAFPIGLVFFIRSSEKTWYYLFSLLLIIIALIATQSRLSIAFAIIFGIGALFVSVVKNNKMSYKRMRMITFSSVSFLLLLFVLAPDLITAVFGRFESLFSSTPSETFLVRLVLWTNALTTFVDNPFLGVGLGHYKILHTIYSNIHLHYMFHYTQGYSAHNMFFHYLAETGIIGTTAVFALIYNQFRLAFKVYKTKKSDLSEIDICLMLVSLLIIVTSFIEAGWMWGQMGYLFLFFIVLNTINYELTIKK